MPNEAIAQQPIFYLFIAFTILMSLGYSWGRRGNKKIYLSAFNAMVETMKPKDQSFTNIGGQTGYHANIIPKKNTFIRRVDATITLLPRQSWLYLPFSMMTMRFDRLFTILFFGKKAMGLLSEGHLIEEKYSRFRGPKITNEESLQMEKLRWGDKDFLLYSKTVDIDEEHMSVHVPNLCFLRFKDKKHFCMDEKRNGKHYEMYNGYMWKDKYVVFNYWNDIVVRDMQCYCKEHPENCPFSDYTP
ncbi:MAG: hypothetical protein ACP5IA_11170 [Sediminispirochaetaceae bacterium]